jgi:DNA-binding SARP family transcriptional activator/tetratricopeptide (TPR) repeat protein
MASGTGSRTAGHRLCLFGPMRVERNGTSVAVPRGDGQRLLGFLALRGSTQRREAVADRLWPDLGGASRRVLTGTIYRLKRRFGADLVCVDADTIALAPGLDTDVQDFAHLVASADPAAIERAIDLYDDLAPGVYDDWVLDDRAACHRSFVGALARLVAEHEASGALDRALVISRQLLVAEPFDEAAHQSHLRLLGRLHRYGEARAHFESFDRLLAEELGVVPLPETVEIIKRLELEREIAAALAEQQQTPFVGRVAERATGVDAIEAASRGRGGVLCVEGVAGIGKSRLLAELVSSAAWRKATVGSAVVAQVPEASSLGPLARSLAPLLSAAVRLELESRLDERSLATIGPLLDESAAGDHPAMADGPSRLRNALRTLGEVLAGRGDVVLAFDDVHWASASTWDHLDSLADGFVNAGGLLILSYRRPEIESTDGWRVLAEWERRGETTIIGLSPLDVDDVAVMLGGGSTVDAEEVVALTGGIPFYVTQGLLDGDWQSGNNGRLDALPDEQRRALQSAAVVGEDVPFRVWVALHGATPLELAAAADSLVAGRWLVPTPDGYAFVHDLVRAAVYDRISPKDRALLHGRAAEAIAASDPDNFRARAYHLDRAGHPIAAARAYREAGRVSADQLAPGDALEAWLRALELSPRRERRERLEIAFDCARAADMGGGAIRREVLTEAIDTARELGDLAALLQGLLLAGGLYAMIGDDADGLAWLTDAEPLARALGDPSLLAEVYYRRGAVVNYQGRWPDGHQLYRQALELVDAHRHPGLHGRILYGLGESAMRMGRVSETVGWVEQALAGYRAAGDSLNEFRMLRTLMIAHFELCDWDRLVETAESCLDVARRVGDRGAPGSCYQALCLAALAVGDRSTAREMLDETEAIWSVLGKSRLLASAVNTRGLIAQDDGDDEEAISLYEAAISAAEAVDGRTEASWARHDLGALYLERGRPSEAIPLLRAAASFWTDADNAVRRASSEACLGLALLDVGAPPDEPTALAESGLRLFRSGDVRGELLQAWMWSLSRLLGRLGRRCEADELLDAAHAELLRQAATIADPRRRRGFFEDVPLNRSIVAAVDARSLASRVAVVRLASSAAPLGRTLAADEFVEVSWTLDAADDAAITDVSERRRYRLSRLLREAAASDAAPTDDDLAAALGVSRRTILRDMELLGPAARRATRRGARSREPAR